MRTRHVSSGNIERIYGLDLIRYGTVPIRLLNLRVGIAQPMNRHPQLSKPLKACTQSTVLETLLQLEQTGTTFPGQQKRFFKQ